MPAVMADGLDQVVGDGRSRQQLRPASVPMTVYRRDGGAVTVGDRHDWSILGRVSVP